MQIQTQMQIHTDTPSPDPSPTPTLTAHQATALIYMSNDIFMEGWGFKTTQTALVCRALVRVRVRVGMSETRA